MKRATPEGAWHRTILLHMIHSGEARLQDDRMIGRFSGHFALGMTKVGCHHHLDELPCDDYQ